MNAVLHIIQNIGLLRGRSRYRPSRRPPRGRLNSRLSSQGRARCGGGPKNGRRANRRDLRGGGRPAHRGGARAAKKTAAKQLAARKTRAGGGVGAARHVGARAA